MIFLKTRFFFKLLLILPIHNLTAKPDTLFVTNSSIKTKVPHSFTKSRSARLVHLTSEKVLKMTIFKNYSTVEVHVSLQ